MREYLVSENRVVLSNIEKEYKKISKLEEEKAKKETNRLAAEIDNYRNNPSTAIDEAIAKEAKKLFYDIDDDTALRRGLFQNIEKDFSRDSDFSKLSDRKKRMKIHEHMKDVMKYLGTSDKQKIIDNYRKTNYENYVNEKTKKLYDYQYMYQSMSEEELEKYILMHYDFRLSKHLFDARKEAIAKVAEDVGCELPLCMAEEENKRAVEKSIKYVVGIEIQNEKDKTLKDKAFTQAKRAVEFIKENPNVMMLISAFGFAVGASTYLGTLALTKSEVSAAAALIFTTPLVAAGLTTVYRNIAVKEDTQSIEETKTLGLYNIQADAARYRKEFFDYHESLKEKYTSLVIEGGNNGLHQ